MSSNTESAGRANLKAKRFDLSVKPAPEPDTTDMGGGMPACGKKTQGKCGRCTDVGPDDE